MSIQIAPACRKSQETKLLVFLLAVLFPLLCVALVGGYGLTLWLYQSVSRGAL